MSFNSRLQVLGATSGSFNTLVAGTQTPSASIPVMQAALRTVACRFDLTAATNTIQLFAEWQGSDDQSTWLNLRMQNNAAAVVVTTGTAAIVSVVLQAPSSVYGFRYCRAVVRNQIVTGAAGDLYVMTPQYVRANF